MAKYDKGVKSGPDPDWHVKEQEVPKVRYGKNLIERMAGTVKPSTKNEDSGSDSPADD
jgi:hypothetical protein